jgi:hypothetical protein
MHTMCTTPTARRYPATAAMAGYEAYRNTSTDNTRLNQKTQYMRALLPPYTQATMLACTVLREVQIVRKVCLTKCHRSPCSNHLKPHYQTATSSCKCALVTLQQCTKHTTEFTTTQVHCCWTLTTSSHWVAAWHAVWWIPMQGPAAVLCQHGQKTRLPPLSSQDRQKSAYRHLQC